MPEFTLSVIHLGNIAELDTVDGNSTAENQSALLGTYFSAANPASHHITTLTTQDVNSDGLTDTNDTATVETVSYDVGSGTVVTEYDALFNLDVTVNFSAASGEPTYNGLGGVIQTETGDLFFVMIDDGEGFGSNPFDDAPIDSITINSISAFGVQQLASASNTQSFVPCFAAGTFLETRCGLVPIEDIAVGDKVMTLDNGLQTVNWVGSHFLNANQLAQRSDLCPIRICAGALGTGYPKNDLIVSPQHRVLLKSKIVQRMTGHAEVFIAAKKLVGLPGIQYQNCSIGVHYHHLAMSAHEVVWANGAPAETLFLGDQLKQGLSRNVRHELEMVMPGVLNGQTSACAEPARPIVQRRARVQKLLTRHDKNQIRLITM